jgi:hypothetical protein
VKSVFGIGRSQVRRSGYGAMRLAGQFAAGRPPDRDSAIGVLRAAVAAGVESSLRGIRGSPGGGGDEVAGLERGADKRTADAARGACYEPDLLYATL